MPRLNVRFETLAEIRMIARAAAKLKISSNRLVTEAAKEVARVILFERLDRKPVESQMIDPESRLTLNQ